MSTHVLVLGNEKGGTGKSTLAVHLAVALAERGVHVVLFDLDERQRTSARYLENRVDFARRLGLDLPMPAFAVPGPEADPGDLVATAGAGVVVLDTPGRDSPQARAALSLADTLVTPINDSFVDFDLIGRVDPETHEVTRPSFYAETVWKARQARARADRGTVDWVVLRNRLSTLEARNRRRVGAALEALSRRVGFRIAPGLSERVIFRELFPRGLTLTDAAHLGEASISHVAARAELRELMRSLALPEPVAEPCR
ncbi:division plane positioning ATPase MipZ [Thermaurantiacus sp.]